MQTENITLSLPKHLLDRVGVLAAERGLSVEGLVIEVLNELVACEDGYEAARQQHMALLERGFDLGTGGTVTWRREDLHYDDEQPAPSDNEAA